MHVQITGLLWLFMVAAKQIFISVSIVIVRYFLSQCDYYLTIKTNWSRYNTEKCNIFIFLNVRKQMRFSIDCCCYLRGRDGFKICQTLYFERTKRYILRKLGTYVIVILKYLKNYFLEFSRLLFGCYRFCFF